MRISPRSPVRGCTTLTSGGAFEPLDERAGAGEDWVHSNCSRYRRAAADQTIERALHVTRKEQRQAHVGWCDAVEHGGAHAIGAGAGRPGLPACHTSRRKR